MNEIRIKNKMKIGNQMIRALYIILGAVFFPVLFCVIFIGNHMNYNEGLKPATLLPNYVMFLMALLVIAVICLLARAAGKVQLTPKVDLIIDIVLAISFLLIFFVNIRITREIAFLLPWDIGVVGWEAQSVAEGNLTGYSAYYSIYSNNVPIVYILKELYSKAASMEGYPHVYRFIWLQVNCAMISIAGFFSCLTVKKLTREFVPTLFSFLLYLALVGISPWKIAPYTDSYGIMFPIMCVYFYVCYRDAKGAAAKYLLIALALISGAAGGIVKPSVFIVIIAVLGVELISFLLDHGKWKYLLAEAALAAILFWARGICVSYMMDDVGLDFNPEVEASWQNYFYMGLNEESTGSYHAGDAAIFGEFQTDKKARNEAALERGLARMKERGVLGSLYFWLRKMTMVFNDGTFGWRGEVWIDGDYPEALASNSRITDCLRDIFWPEGSYKREYDTFAQTAWILCISGVFGICFCPREQRGRYAVMVVSFLGIFFYQMLFEARARYLFVFLPLLVTLALCGIWQYVHWMAELTRGRKFLRQKEPSGQRADGGDYEVGKLSKERSKKRFLIAAAVVLAVHAAFFLFFGTRKAAFHEDEYFTYYYGAGHDVVNPYGSIQEKTGSELLNNFTVIKENRFRFDRVVGLSAIDVHPPLYYMSLHFMMSLFPYQFYKWFAILLNGGYSLVVCAGVMSFIFRLDKSRYRYFLALLTGVLYAVHPASISCVMFNRMYAMSAMWTVLYMNVLILLMENLTCRRKRFAVLTLCGSAICGLAFLTHYFCMYNLFFLTLGFCVYALFRKLRYKERCFVRMLVYGCSMVAAIGLAVLVFPASIDQIFFGEQGEGAFYGLFHIPTAYMFDLFMPVLNRNFFAGMMYPALAILGLALIVRAVLRVKRGRKTEGDVSTAFIAIGLLSSAVIVWLLCKTSLFLGDASSRYFYPAAALVLPVMVYCVCGTFLEAAELLPGKRVKAAACGGLSALVLFPAILGHIQGNVLFLYRDKLETLQYARDNAQYPLVMVYNRDTRYKTWYIANETWPYENVVFVMDDGEETVLDSEILRTAEKLIVYMDNPVEILDRLVAQNENLSSWSLLRHDHQYFVYVVE